MNRAHILSALLIALLSITAVDHAAAAVIVGSQAIPRDNLDTASGSVYIYAGGTVPSGSEMGSFTFYGSATSPGYITPILFEQTSSGVFAVRGLGTGRIVTGSSSPQSFGFDRAIGSDIAANGNYTFGFINSLLDSSGDAVAQSTGTVDMTFEAVQPGNGLGGAATSNRWVYTPSTLGIDVPLGTTFGVPGTVADFVLNDPSSDPVNHSSLDRTYSANLSAAVPEPSTLMLIAVGMIPFGFFVRWHLATVEPRDGNDTGRRFLECDGMLLTTR